MARLPTLAHDLAVDPADPNTFYVAGGGVWRSRNRGVTWEPLSTWAPLTLRFHPTDPQVLYGSDYNGVFKMTLPAQP